MLKRIFFLDIIKDTFYITDDNTIHYMFFVLRMKIQDKVIIFNDTGEYLCSISKIDKKQCVCKVLEKIKIPCSIDFVFSNLHFAIPIIKQENMLNCSDMLTQAGILNFDFINYQFSKKNTFYEKKIKKRVINSIQQSNRMIIPKINYHVSLQEFLNINQEENIIFFANFNGESITKVINKLFIQEKIDKNRFLASKIILIVGPEGGLSVEEEKIIIKRNNTYQIKLNEYILRSETACISLFNNINFLYSIISNESQSHL